MDRHIQWARLFKLAVLALAFLAAGVASAQYPQRPIRMLVPFVAGGPADVSARSIATALSQSMGQQVVVDNRPGADGQIAAQEAKRAAPDGYTIFLGSASALSAAPFLRKVPPYDPIADFTPLAALGNFTLFLVVHPSVPANTVEELVRHLRANPGKLNYASSNVTSIVAMSSLLSNSGTDMVHVPYKGEAPALPDLVSGRVQAMVVTLASAMPLAKEGKLRVLAALLPQRSALAPDVPTMAEAGYPVVAVAPWAGFVAPAGLPADITQRLSQEINAALQRPEVRQQQERIGVSLSIQSHDAFGAFMRAQLASWREAIRIAKLPQE